MLLPPVRASRVRRRDVYRVLRSALLEGVLASGERLPSTRQAAADYGVSRGLMEEVFGQLAEEGFLDRAVGRGTFVAARAARLVSPTKPAAVRRRSPSPRPFNAGTADTADFPWRIWQRLQNRAGRELGPLAMSGADPRGVPALRSAIARYLAQLRGIRCKPEQVIVFNSACSTSAP